ncbi:PREDICTED: von Willebrand factor A domain-containing protein 5A-like [Thamnophis sirtalis]|uniref:von Willebrand factor A domain-containing protein 5A-like n=1 Tax=Thamnophis sirtalis TaxID=35019 RepID=A0A6I9YNE5_9SAUR|nr:PREDICTED: von Willebrand factor A domain-containing protein 5A-like [Thamnophis sirtalis]
MFFASSSFGSFFKSSSKKKGYAAPPVAVGLSCCPATLKNSSSSRPKEEESPLLKLVSLQNADGSWPHGPVLAAILDLSEADVVSDIWATVLAVLWLHLKAAEQKDEWELLEGKAVHWLQMNAGDQLAKYVNDGNDVLGSRVSPQVFGL